MEYSSSFDLVQRFQRGETQAFSLLFHRYKRRLAVLIHYKMSDELRSLIEVDDILQEVFLVAARDLESFNYRSPGGLIAWFSKIADHTIIDTVRHEGRAKRKPDELMRFRSESNPDGPEPIDSDTPSRVFARSESMKGLIHKMDSLSPDHRKVLLLAKFEGLTTAEIATEMAITREKVALLLHRALKRFREFSDQGPDS
jgi:RNA polymerase sigma factor (sigma-70 family)